MNDKNRFNYLSIAEIRFSPIVNLSEFIHAIQLAFNLANYSDSANIKSQTLQVQEVEQQKLLVPSIQNSYVFSNKNKTRHFILNAQCLTFKTSDFSDFDSFSSYFLEGIFIVNKVYPILTFNRLGLRFLDRFIPAKGKRIQHYMAMPDLMVFEKLRGDSTHSLTEVYHQVKDQHLVNRVKVCKSAGLELPKDIDPLDMKFKADLMTYSGSSIYIDNDGFIDKKYKLSFTTVKKVLNELNLMIQKAYQASIAR
jgi:uncharacterized protein (TIGR04255 family)